LRPWLELRRRGLCEGSCDVFFRGQKRVSSRPPVTQGFCSFSPWALVGGAGTFGFFFHVRFRLFPLVMFHLIFFWPFFALPYPKKGLFRAPTLSVPPSYVSLSVAHIYLEAPPPCALKCLLEHRSAGNLSPDFPFSPCDFCFFFVLFDPLFFLVPSVLCKGHLLPIFFFPTPLPRRTHSLFKVFFGFFA